jgi:hypothetical protein
VKRATALAFVALLATACIEPHERRPGLWLRGDVVETPVSDWSFSDAQTQIFVETRTWYLVPHSVTTVCAAAGERLWVPSVYFGGGSFPESRFWNRNVARDSRVRLKIGDALYSRRAVLVTDDAERDEALAAFAAKYPFWSDLLARPEAERPPIALLRMDPPEARPAG